MVLLSPVNRFGDTSNVQHIHYGILASFLKCSYKRTRPAIGICAEYKSIEKLFEHNRRFTQGNRFLPAVPGATGGVRYGSVVCTHLNLSFRLIKNGFHSYLGDLIVLMR